jgi:anaerobic magnesium-protoporphyrin IX monomethyl ester cyclase
MVKQQLGDKRHWRESNDLEMMFAGTYTSDFYRELRNLLHDEVVHAGAPALQDRWNELIDREEEFRQDRALLPPGAMKLAHA